MNELALRVVTALVLLAAVLAWYLWLSGSWFNGLLLLAALLAVHESLRLSRLPYPAVYLLLAAPILAWLVMQGALVGLPVLLLLWLAVYVGSSRAHEVSFAAFLATAWTVSWLALCVWTVAVAHGDADGRRLVAAACLAVWASDIAAYFAGRRWGRHRLCPRISPGKTIEGLSAGLLAGGVVMTGMLGFWQLLSGPLAVALACFVVCAGVLGDLAESAFKRMQGVKDSGAILPGHGGLLDRIDALLLAVPAAYLAWSQLR